jgi:hypothetical protein
MAARADETDEETPVYVVWRPPLETTKQWVERCKPLRARQSTIVLRRRATGSVGRS